MTDILQKALEWAIAHHTHSSLQHRCAFANSVQYLCTGGSGGFGGPSLREHLCIWSLAGVNGKITAVNIGEEAMTAIAPDGSLPRPGSWEFEAACEHCAPLCFNPIAEFRVLAIQIREREHCFDDDPKDLADLRKKSA